MWDKVMDVVKVAAIPITVALVGYFIQQGMQDDQLRTERLKLSVGILSDREASPALKQFGISLLRDSLPDGVQLTKALVLSLESGETSFPKYTMDAFVFSDAKIRGFMEGQTDEPKN